MTQGDPLLTLIVAPAGFGKTIAAAEWARRDPQTAWLTVDAGDSMLDQFWVYLREALQNVTPAFGQLVTQALSSPLRPSAASLGYLLADELLDAAAPVRVVIDDLHAIPPGEVHEFLGGLLAASPPALQLVVTSRIDPPLSLERVRLRRAVRDLRSPDLLFTEEEAQALIARVMHRETSANVNRMASDLFHETRGWPAGAHLRALSLQHRAGRSSIAEAQLPASDSHLLGLLLNEILTGLHPDERRVLLRAAIPEAVTPQFVAALTADLDAATPLDLTSLIRFAQASDLCRPSARLGGEWLEFHPLFREVLQNHLVQDTSAEELRDLHQRTADWLEAADMTDASIPHRVAAGQIDAAVALVEQAVNPAFDREDWAAVASWLALLPEEVVLSRTELLTSRAWVTHLRGQALYQSNLRHLLESRIEQGAVPPTRQQELRAELDLLAIGSLIPLQVNPEAAIAITRQAIAHVPRERRFPHGVAWGILGVALQAAGRHTEARDVLTAWAESTPGRADAASVRGLLGLLLVHTQAGELAQAASVARLTLDVTHRYGLRLTTGWADRFLGDILYEQGDLPGAQAHYTAVVRNHEFAHLIILRESLFRLALTYHAQGNPGDAWRALQRCRDIIISLNALEHLPAVDAYEAYLSLREGKARQALTWARAHQFSADSSSLHVYGHPACLRAEMLATAGSAAELDQAIALLAELQERATQTHFVGPLVRINALAAVSLARKGAHQAAIQAMDESLVTGSRYGFNRTYLDLIPAFREQLTTFASELTFPDAVSAALMMPEPDMAAPPGQTSGAAKALTRREFQILRALAQRLSYKEIADQLFISPFTVKSHASNIYGKLNVTGRTDAIRAARECEWIP